MSGDKDPDSSRDATLAFISRNPKAFYQFLTERPSVLADFLMDDDQLVLEAMRVHFPDEVHTLKEAAADPGELGIYIRNNPTLIPEIFAAFPAFLSRYITRYPRLMEGFIKEMQQDRDRDLC